MTMTDQYIEKIKNSRVYEVARISPLDPAPLLSSRLKNNILLKREDTQSVFSFKLRGAYNKISSLSATDRKQGIIAASAGNHAQGVALAGKTLGIHTTIVMPETTPQIKVDAVAHKGAEIILYGDTYDQAYEHAVKIARDKNLIFIHPYDDPEVIAGQGTIGKEICEQYPHSIDAVFIPVGGGGLIAGIGIYLKHHNPAIRIIGVEPEDAPTLHHALASKKRVILDNISLFADGVAVRQIGAETFRIAQQVVDEVVLVKTDEICAAIKDNFDETRTLVEPAGALATAGVKKYIEHHQLHDKTFIAIISGANINFDRLKHIVERYEIGENTESLFAVTIPEQPGSFLTFCRLIGKRTITEFNYRYSNSERAHIFVGLKFQNADKEKATVIQQLENNGYAMMDISNNEMAKLHLRHMIGGPAAIAEERLFRFQFPERPGALLEFLESMQRNWNISLFHYRNHGAAYGRILVGIQVPDHELEELNAVIDKLGYVYYDESNNPAYRLMLR